MPSKCSPDKRISDHARIRMDQRAIGPALVWLVLTYGRHDHAGEGVDRYYFGHKEAARARADGHAVRDGWPGTGLLVGLDGTIISAVRYRRPPRP